MARVVGVASALLLYGCSTQAFYEGMRSGGRNQCNRLPELERQQCLERIADDYDTYRRKREEVVGSPRPE